MPPSVPILPYMRPFQAILLLTASFLFPLRLQAEDQTEKIVFLRHGEKPAGDLGQLTPQGLNRALALPKVLDRYGKPAFIFAPLSTPKGGYNYVRALATIEPTAIRLGLPVQTPFSFDEIDKLQAELLKPAYQNSLIFVAWEHHFLELLVRKLEHDLNGPDQVPKWDGQDYDGIYFVTIQTAADGTKTIHFQRDAEGLTPSPDFP